MRVVPHKLLLGTGSRRLCRVRGYLRALPLYLLQVSSSSLQMTVTGQHHDAPVRRRMAGAEPSGDLCWLGAAVHK